MDGTAQTRRHDSAGLPPVPLSKDALDTLSHWIVNTSVFADQPAAAVLSLERHGIENTGGPGTTRGYLRHAWIQRRKLPLCTPET